MVDDTNTPNLKTLAAARAYLGFDADQQRAFQDLILHPTETMETNHHDPGSWQDIDGVLGPIEWAWQPWLPIGMLTLLAGESGAGKSALALRLAGCFLMGWEWPDKAAYQGETGAIVWAECEAAQALNLARAKAWGLPLEKIYTPLDDPLADFRLDVPAHLAALYEKAYRDDVRLIVVDSLRGSHRQNEDSSERMELVHSLAELGRDTNKCILITHHLRKRSIFDSDSVDLERLRGSTAIAQPCRIVMAMDTPDPNIKEWKRLQVVKSNLAAYPGHIGLTITDAGLRFGTSPETPKVETVIDTAMDLLKALLQDDPKPYDKVQDEFKAAGISRATMERAKKRLGVVSRKQDDGWYWGLPAVRVGYTDD